MDENKKAIIWKSILWIILAVCIAGLIWAIVVTCTKNENYSYIIKNFPKNNKGMSNNTQKNKYKNFATYNRSSLQNTKGYTNIPQFERCGPKCQINQHGPVNPYYYPVLKPNPINCNEATPSWISSVPTEDIDKDSEYIDGKYYRCNRSCPPPEVACGLDGYGLSQGVM